MLFDILSKLFSRDAFDTRYSPKPADQWVSLLMMSLGTVTFVRDGWTWFGICSFVLGFLLGLTIILCMNWEKVIEYWMTINEHVKLMDKIKNPDLWYALGYKEVPEAVRVIENLNDGHTLRFTEVPIPVTNMNMLANKVLGSGKLTFSEKEYSAIIPNFRKVKKEWKEKGYLKPNNHKNPRLGDSFTRKGIQVLYEFASQEYKLKEDNHSEI